MQISHRDNLRVGLTSEMPDRSGPKRRINATMRRQISAALARGMTQAQVGQAFGVHQSSISRIMAEMRPRGQRRAVTAADPVMFARSFDNRLNAMQAIQQHFRELPEDAR